MNLELTTKQFRRLLDMIYIGNWILNSARGDDRIEDYDKLESYVFSHCKSLKMDSLTETFGGEIVPSHAFVEGGIHEAIMDYEDAVFFEILAEELARRDLEIGPGAPADSDALNERISRYISEFEQHGTDNLELSID